MRRFAVIGVLVLLAACARADTGQKLSYADLVGRLTDLEGLSVLPQVGERCEQWSSYDRASAYDSATGKYVKWDANGDGHGIIREQDGLDVMAEIEGPGCIWRIWSARAKEGRVKIYLDGAPEPAVDLPFSDYFSLRESPFTYPALVHITSSGCNNYVPIPFQKSCKIVAQDGWGNYYHFTYGLFPKGTIVPTFKRDLSPAESLALAKANLLLSRRLGTDPAGERRNAATATSKLTLKPGKCVIVAALKGPRAITSIKVDPGKLADPWQVLRSVALRIRWDGEQSPSVWSPLGDFFGTAPGINPYKSLPMGMTDDGFYSYWYMPFARSASVELVNDGNENVALELSITHAPLSRDIKELGRFHAKWHRDAFAPVEPERRIDWTMLKTQGRGRYCGVMLHVYNPKSGWWGEGDEKFFVDSEKFPSTFGTGSEDYFGYAWCNPALFQNAYHNQTINQSSNAGNVSVNRWHIADNVPFQKFFEACIEKYYPNDRPTLYAATAYWYEAPGGNDPYGSVGIRQRVGYFAF